MYPYSFGADFDSAPLGEVKLLEGLQFREFGLAIPKELARIIADKGPTRSVKGSVSVASNLLCRRKNVGIEVEYGDAGMIDLDMVCQMALKKQR